MRIAHQQHFSEKALLDLGFTYAGKDWGNGGIPYYEYEVGCGQLYVVHSKEVWLSVGNGLRQLEKVRNTDQLEQLIALL